jgi:hypothetical protein
LFHHIKIKSCLISPIKAHVHWQSLLAKVSSISRHGIDFLTCLGNWDHFYLCNVTQAGQVKYSSECHMPLSPAVLPYHKSLPMEIWLNENMGQKQFCKGMEQCALKNVHNCLNTNIDSYLETCGGQSSNPYLNVVHFFSTRDD